MNIKSIQPNDSISWRFCPVLLLSHPVPTVQYCSSVAHYLRAYSCLRPPACLVTIIGSPSLARLNTGRSDPALIQRTYFDASYLLTTVPSIICCPIHYYITCFLPLDFHVSAFCFIYSLCFPS